MTQQETKARKFVQIHQDILNELGANLIPHSSKILDFGCGKGNETYLFRKMGFKAYGCDIKNSFEATLAVCKEEKLIDADENIFGIIDLNDYRIPFADETFDYVYSNQVFEHVQNYSEALSEIHRVLKPGGTSVHFFPARYRPIECHVFVPFAGIFRGYGYLSFWAFLGIRNPHQKGLSFKEVAKNNHHYLNTRTTYFKKAEIQEKVFHQFENISFIEKYFIKHGGGRLSSFRNLPFIDSLIRTFHTRAIFFKKLY
jgi:ubiquinone/menaquinone biosynthesis C-methylase UbiE